MSFNIGDHVGDYEIIGVLGAGGMGKVYKVRNLISDRVEAMKVLLPDLANVPELADRFVREIKVLASLDHPGIASLRTAQRIENRLIMIMELVEGVTLEQKLHDGPLPVPEAIDYITQVLDALAFAHARGVIHRDIKPANMMLTPGSLIKLMDFGIAKAAGDRRLTMTGTTMGSLYYMSPEQIQGVALDPRSDLYSLGISLYELVTGARPFQGDSDFSIMSAHLQQQPVPPVELDPKLPPALNEIILISITKDSAKRFQTAEAFHAALESVQRSLGGAPVRAASAARVPPLAAAAAPPAFEEPAVAPAPPRSHRGLYMAIGALAAIAVLVLAATQIPRWMRTRASSSPPVQTQTLPTPEPGRTPPVTTAPAPEPAVKTAPPAQSTSPSAKTPMTGRVSSPARESAQPRPQTGAGSVQTQSQASPAAGPAPPAAQERRPAVTNPLAGVQPTAADPAAAALDDLKDRMTLLTSRVVAVRTSVQNMQRQQARAGLSLRPDIAAALTSMEQFMDQTESALGARDVAAARRSMDRAEREVERLEKFLGR